MMSRITISLFLLAIWASAAHALIKAYGSSQVEFDCAGVNAFSLNTQDRFLATTPLTRTVRNVGPAPIKACECDCSTDHLCDGCTIVPPNGCKTVRDLPGKRDDTRNFFHLCAVSVVVGADPA